MTTSQKTRKNAPQSKRKPIPLRERAINVQRQRNRLYEFVIKTLERECEVQGLKRVDLAALLDTNPSQITRWLSGPGNWEIDTVSDLLNSVGGEVDYKFVPFSERLSHKGNFQHELAQSPIIAITREGIGERLTPTQTKIIAESSPPKMPEDRKAGQNLPLMNVVIS